MARHKNKFSDRKHSVGGVISTLMSVCAIVFVVLSVVASFKARGKGGTVVGSYALIAMLVSFFGCLMGLFSYKESNRYYTFSFIGSLLNGIVLICLVLFMIIGL